MGGEASLAEGSPLHLSAGGLKTSRRSLLGAGLALGLGTTDARPETPSPRVPVKKMGPWVDAHVHLQSPDWFTANVFQGAPPQIRRRLVPAPPRGRLSRGGDALEAITAAEAPRGQYGPSLADQTRRLLAEMDSAGIDTAILYAMDYDYTNAKLKVAHWQQLEALAAVRDAYPKRFVLFAAIDPRRGRAGVEMLRRAATELKIAGMGEFAPQFFGFAPNDRERCYPIYEVCAELGLHIAPNCSIISSSVSRWCDPIYFEDVAQDFPQVNICLTSAGLPWWSQTAMALAQSKPNIYLDIGDWQTRYAPDPIGATLGFVRDCLATDARHKIMFGSDFPVFHRTVSEQTWVGVFTHEAAKRGFEFSPEDLNLFFSDNAQEYLNRDLSL